MRTDLLSGDANKQAGALMSAFALLSAGRDAGPLVSAALQLLGNPSTAAEPKRLAYDLALAAQLSDAGAAGRQSYHRFCMPCQMKTGMRPCRLVVPGGGTRMHASHARARSHGMALPCPQTWRDCRWLCKPTCKRGRPLKCGPRPCRRCPCCRGTASRRCCRAAVCLSGW